MLESDSSRILQRLLKFPPVEHIQSIINMAINYKDYILGGCTSAKPSILPGATSSAPISSPISSPIAEPRSIPTPLSQAPVKKPVPASVPEPEKLPKKTPNILETDRHFNRQISMQPTPVKTSKLPEEGPKIIKDEDPLGASASKPARSSPLEPPKPILQSGDSRPMVDRVTEVIKLLQSQISSHGLDEVKMVRAIDTLKSVKRDLLKQLAKNTAQGI